MPDRSLPRDLTRHLGERREPTPADQLDAYLARARARGALERPRRKPRIGLNVGLLIVGLAIWAIFGWALTRYSFA